MNYDYTSSICKIFNALSRQTTFNKILFVGSGCLVYAVAKLRSKTEKQQEQIDDLVREVNTLKREKETNECNA